MSGWGCPHEIRGACQRVSGRPCDPGMKGCILYGRFVFSDPAKNRPPARRTEASRASNLPGEPSSGRDKA